MGALIAALSGSVTLGGLSPHATKHVRYRLGFPPASARRGDSTRVEGGGDLSKRLRTGGLSLGDDGRDGGCMRGSPGPR